MISIILLFLVILTYLFIKKKKNNLENFIDNKPNIWLYWENKPGSNKSDYLNLCYDTIIKHCSKTFNIHLLDEKKIFKYLPNTRKDLDKKLNIPQKTDYYRYRLLYKYGGIWIDSDTIVMSDLSEIVEKLEKHDYVGFGCHYTDCKDGGYPRPANWVMASRKNGILMKALVDESEKIVNKKKIGYHDLGRKMIWKKIDELKANSDWDYYHYDSKCLERDSRDRKLQNHISISNEDVDKNCLDKHLFIPIYNTAPGFPDWFVKMDKKQIMDSDMHIGKLFKKSLN